MSFRTAFLSSILVAGAFAAGIGPVVADQPFDLSPEQPGRVRAGKSEAVIAGIPADFKFAQDGKFTVAITPDGLPPIATFATDTTTIVGADPDIALIIADKLGRELDLVPVAWEDWPLGLVSGKYDAVINNVGVTEERKKKYDFSSYRQGLHGFYVSIDSPIRKIAEPRDIAGLRVITDAGTIQEKIILEWNRLNEAAGLEAADIIYFDDVAASSLAIRSGRADTIFSMNSVQAYQAALTGETRAVGTVNAGWPLTTDVGVTTRKDSGLAAAITGALNEAIAGGEYRRILDRWKLSAESIEASRTNPPGLASF
jgi:polar amino acid transport system substrate-binding protein